MIDHLSTYARDYLVTKAFYTSVFAPLGYSIQAEFTVEEDPEFNGRRVCAFGEQNNPTFWVIETRKQISPRHIAFVAPSREAVDRFHTVAVESGAQDNGKPGLRPEYHDSYYGAFVFDPDGNDIEAVFHQQV